MLRRLTTLLACLLIAAVATGCSANSREPQPVASEPAATGHINPGQTTQPIAGLTDMPAAQKTAELSPQFVTEWPVVSGTVVSAEAIDANKFQFVLTVNAPVASIAEWYRSVAQGRAFILTGEESADDGTVTLKFYRAGMTYVVEIAPQDANTSRVQATLTTRAETTATP